MIGKLKRLIWWILARTPVLKIVAETRATQTPVRVGALLRYRLGRKIGRPYWPIHPTSIVVDPAGVVVGIETSPGLMPGCYIQGSNGIEIGDYTQIAANVVMISANHALTDNRKHVAAEPIRIGAYCWLGANVVILPGVQLGTYTVVGAGAVVTKSFPDGHCVIAGNPARLIRRLEPADCVLHRSVHEYNGFIPHRDFEAFRRRNLSR